MKKEENGALFTIEGREDKVGNIYFVTHARGKNGAGTIKKLTYEQMMEALSTNYRKEIMTLPIGELPEGYLDAVVTEDGVTKVRIYVPEQKRIFQLKLDGQKLPVAYTIPMPPMVFHIQRSCTSHGGSDRYHGDCCIVKGTYKEVKEDYYNGKLQGYLYPFGNVNDNGGICMGNIRVPMESISDVSMFVDAFFDGITNHDYVNGGSRVRNGMGQMQLLKELNGKDKFPLKWLKMNHFSFLKPMKN